MADRNRDIQIGVTIKTNEASKRAAVRALQEIRQAAQDFQRGVISMQDFQRTIGQADVAAQQARSSFRLFGAEINVAKFAAYALTYTLLYRSINLVAAAMRDAVGSAIEFDKSLRNVNTIARLSESALSDVGQQILKMSTEAMSGQQPIKDLTDALYKINSSGIIGAESLDVLRASAATATAGFAPLEQTTTAIVAVLNAYGLSVSDAAHVSDVLSQTVKVGVPNMEQLSHSFGTAAATASLAGVSLDELGLAWAAISRVLPSAELTTTALNRAIIAFIKPSAEMSHAVKELGFASALTMLKQVGLIQSVQNLATLAKGNANVIGQMFDDRRGLQAVSALLATITSATREWNQAGGVAGATQRALNEQLKSGATEVDSFRRQWQRFSIEMGQTVAGPGARLLGWLADMLARARELGSTLHRSFQVFQEQQAAFRRTPSEITRGEALRSVRTINAGELRRPIPVAEATGPSLEELQALFELHKALRQFDMAGEIRALGDILIPRVNSELEKARRTYAGLKATLGADAKETQDALREVHGLERELLKLEGDRVEKAIALFETYKRQADVLKRATEALAEAQIRALIDPARLGGQIAGLREAQFRGGLTGEETDPAKIARVYASIRARQQQSFGEEERSIRQALAKAKTDEQRVRLGEQLLQLTIRQAQAQSTLNREEFDAVKNARDRKLDNEIILLRQKLELLQRLSAIGAATPAEVAKAAGELSAKELEQSLRGMSPQGLQQFIYLTRRELTALVDQMGRATTQEEQDALKAQATAARARLNVALGIETSPLKPFEDTTQFEQAANKARGIINDIIVPALKNLSGEAQKATDQAYQKTLDIYNQMVSAWGAMGRDAGREFRERFLEEYYQLPGFMLPKKGGSVPQMPSAGGGGGTTTQTNNITIHGGGASPAVIAQAVVGALGDRAVQREVRLRTGGVVV